MRLVSTFALSLLLLLAGPTACQKKKKTKITNVKIEPVKPKKPQVPKMPGKRYPEQIKNRDPQTLLGGERGLDHVGVAIKDLEGASQAYEKLGFGNPQRGKLPNGLKNVNYYFGDTTYLELVTTYDDKKNPWVASFIKRHQQGAMFLMLCVFSYSESANLLRRQGFKVGPPRPGRIKTKGGRDGYYHRGRKKPPQWNTFVIEDNPLPGNITFITYNRGLRNFVLYKIKKEKIRRKLFTHPNTALGLSSAWIAVKDLKRTAALFEKVGLKPGRRLKNARLDADGVEIAAGQGKLLLLQPQKGKNSPVAAFLKRRGEGIIGLSFRVEKLEAARALVQKNLGTELETYDGHFGSSVLVPAEKAFGVWVEFHQR